MSKFAQAAVTPRGSILTGTEHMLTHEGGLGFARDAKSELFLLAVSNMVSERTFYESASARDSRFRALIREVTAADPTWVALLVPYLRSEMNMRSASVVMAAEYVAAGGPNGRKVVDGAIKRADEPAEMLAYWTQAHGRKVPQPVKRGVADAVRRLYTERNALKYDGTGQKWRFADVIELTHPKPTTEAQASLFKYLLDARHHGDGDPTPLLAQDRILQALPVDARRANLHAAVAAEWDRERLAGWLPGGMDAEAYEAIVPNMGVMALVRNLRNFDRAGVSDATAHDICDKISNPELIRRSGMFPIRFLSAYRSIESLRWAGALECALEASLENVPVLTGSTLILIDISGSMEWAISDRSERKRVDVAAAFGLALAKQCEHADVVLFNTDVYVLNDADIRMPLLRGVDAISAQVGGGTYTGSALQRSYVGQKRVIILTDEQADDDIYAVSSAIVPLIYTFNVGGYAPAQMEAGRGRYAFGGLSDAGFKMLSLLEHNRDAGWPHL